MGLINRKPGIGIMLLQLTMKAPSNGDALVKVEAPGLQQSTETTSPQGVDRLPGEFSAYPQNMGVVACWVES